MSNIKKEPFISLNAIVALQKRYLVEYKQVCLPYMMGDLVERLLFFIAFGFGLGGAVKTMGNLPYLTFLAPGVFAATGLFIMHRAMCYGAYGRYKENEIWQSWLATPIKLQEIILSEILYAVLRSVSPSLMMLVIAFIWGAVPSIKGAVIAFFVVTLANFTYGAFTVAIASYMRRSLYFSYINTLWIMPMYLFSGVFFDLSQTPTWMQATAYIFPLAHVIDIVRPLMTGQEISAGYIAIRMFALFAIFVITYFIAYRKFKIRLLS